MPESKPLRMMSALHIYDCPNGHVWTTEHGDPPLVNIVCPSCQRTAFRRIEEGCIETAEGWDCAIPAYAADDGELVEPGDTEHDPRLAEGYKGAKGQIG